MESLKEEIELVKTQILAVEQAINEVEKKLMEDLSLDDKRYYRNEEKQLRDKKKQLRDKEIKLLDEEKQLREEKLILLQNAPAINKKIRLTDSAQGARREPTLHSLLNVKSVQVENKRFDSVQSILEYFQSSFLKMALSDNGHLPADSNPLLRVNIPLNTYGQPDMLRVSLPAASPCHQRTSNILKQLQEGKHVFAAAVSGAGKTKLAFDIARKAFSLYFDMYGGFGEVKQKDVFLFMSQCKLLNAGQDRPVDVVVSEFDHLIGSLFLARWIALLVAKERFPELSPEQWLWMQTDFPCLTVKCYMMCIALPLGTLDRLRKVLASANAAPLVEIDAAENLLVYEHWFRSQHYPEAHRSLGFAMVGWLAQRSIGCLCSGIDLRLKDFHANRSASGGENAAWAMYYDFDYLDQTAVHQLLDHFLYLSQVDGVENVLSLLQGRPRFAASAIKACVTGSNPVESILAYTERMIVVEDGDAAIRAHWKCLYEYGGITRLQNAGDQTVWSIAFNMLTRSLFVPSEGEFGGAKVTFPLDNHKEVMSHGVSMIKTIDGEPHEFMAEPLVLSSGLTFCLEHPGLDIASDLLQKLSDVTTSDPQHRRELLEFLVVARVFESPARFMKAKDWPDDVQLSQLRPFGVLVGVPLTDPRVSLATLHQTPAATLQYWLALPENQAGPDLVAPRMLVSMKSSIKDRVTRAKSKISIKTTTPSLLYTRVDGSQYGEASWQQKHEEVCQAVSNWSAPIVRVRIELPAASIGTTPGQVVSTDGKWHCDLYDVKNNERGSDVMLYVSAESTETLLGFSWT